MKPPTFFSEVTLTDDEQFSIVVALSTFPANPPVELKELIWLAIFFTEPYFKWIFFKVTFSATHVNPPR